MTECKFEDKIETMHEDIKEIKLDIRSLLQFKWQLVGIVAFATVATSIIVSLMAI